MIAIPMTVAAVIAAISAMWVRARCNARVGTMGWTVVVVAVLSAAFLAAWSGPAQPIQMRSACAHAAVVAAALGGAIPLAAIDARSHLLPNRAVAAAAMAVVITVGFAAIITGSWRELALHSVLFCGVGSFAVGLMLVLIAPHIIGAGDVKYAPVLLTAACALCGPVGAIVMLVVTVIAAGFGAVVVALARKTLSGDIAMGPFFLTALVATVLLVESGPWWR